MAISWLAKIVAGTNVSPRTIALGLAVALLPIAMVYQLAHYSTFLFVNGQQIIRLASDPFGYGYNLFGTASFEGRLCQLVVNDEFRELTDPKPIIAMVAA